MLSSVQLHLLAYSRFGQGTPSVTSVMCHKWQLVIVMVANWNSTPSEILNTQISK